MFLLTFICYVTLGVSLQNGIISFGILFFTNFIYFSLKPNKITFSKMNILDLVIINFLIWSIISIFDVLFFKKPILVYLKGFSYCLFPVFAYFSFSYSRVRVNFEVVNEYFKWILLTTMIAVSIGVYFYLFSPTYYVKYVLGNYEGLINDSDSIFMARLLSYFGDPTVMGNISVISLPILMYQIRIKQKPFTTIYFNTFCFIILVFGVLLSFARSAWVACLIYLLYIILFNNKYFFSRIIGIIFVLITSVSLIFASNLDFEDPIITELQKRIFSLGGSFDERSTQVEYALVIIKKSPLGIGLGQVGHKSVSSTINLGVFDNNYLRIFAETGILGFLSFLLIIFTSLFLGLKKSINKRINNIRILLFIIFLMFYFQSIGSNLLDLHYSSFLFCSFLCILAWTYLFDFNNNKQI